MSSIRRKLAETTLRLDQMQDLGGCRAILNDIDGVSRVVERIRERSLHVIRKEWDYIRNPKDDGYRSHHLSLVFHANRRADEVYEGRRIELQVRTRLQHSWATAIEAVSCFSEIWVSAAALKKCIFEGSLSPVNSFQLSPGESLIPPFREDLSPTSGGPRYPSEPSNDAARANIKVSH